MKPSKDQKNSAPAAQIEQWGCVNHKHGLHNFPYPGADCLRCGISQDELSGRRIRKLNKIL